MLKINFSWLSGRKVSPDQSDASGPAVLPASVRDQAYPAIDAGIIATTTIDGLLANHVDLIDRMRVAAGGDDADFDRQYLFIIRRLAAWIHSIPATETGNHSGAGGLLRLCLQLAFHCLQSADQSLFARSESAEDRRRIEPCWRYACFLAGLFSELYNIPCRLIVTTGDGATWPIYLMPLTRFCHEQKAHRYFIRFVPNPEIERSLSMSLMHQIVTPDTLQFLVDGHHAILPTLLAALSGIQPSAEYAKMAEILNQYRHKIAEVDVEQQPQRYGKLAVGVHLEPYLMDAMRSLYREGTWAVNQKKARLWFGKDGLYLIWKTALKELSELLKKNGVAGVPDNPDSVAELLYKAGVLDISEAGSLYFSITPPESEKAYEAVKIKNPVTLFGTDSPEALKTSLTQPKLTKAPRKTTSKSGDNHDLFQVTPSPSTPVSKPENAADETVRAPAPPVVEPMQEQPTSAEFPFEVVQNDQSQVHGQSDGGYGQHSSTEEHNGQTEGSSTPPDYLNSDHGLALAEVPPVEMKLSELAERLIGQLSDPMIGEFLRGLVIDVRTKKVDGFGATPHGFAIDRDLISYYGIDETTLLTKLTSAGWLGRDPAKPNAKYAAVEVNGHKFRAMLIKQHVANDLGLTDEG